VSALTGKSEDRADLGGDRWYAVQTLAKREMFAASQLAAQDFHTFLPYLMKTVRHARRVRQIKAAVFPGYLFVSLNVRRDRWRSINGTRGVVRVISAPNDGPQPLPVGVIETLADYVDENGVCRLDRDLTVGQAVRVIAGPLAEAIGTLARRDDKGRVKVLLNMLGGQVYVSLNRSALEAA
jgi:transcription antitermination factor NusG